MTFFKNPDPSKVAKERTTPLLHRIKPFDCRVEWFLWFKFLFRGPKWLSENWKPPLIGRSLNLGTFTTRFGQTTVTSAKVTLNGGLVGESPKMTLIQALVRSCLRGAGS